MRFMMLMIPEVYQGSRIRDLNEAIQVASKWPSARFGSIEVRPVEPVLRDEWRYPK